MVQFYKAPKRNKKTNSAKNNSVNSKGKKEIIQLDTFDHAANGVCLSTQPITIVEHALPNELCEVLTNKETKQVRFARVHKVLEANPQRQIPFCEHYDKCGACGLQHTNAEYGLSIKNEALQSFLQKQSDIEQGAWLAPISSNYPDYRRRVRLAVDARALLPAGSTFAGSKPSVSVHSESKAKIGYRSVQSNKVVDIPYCAIAKPEINEVLAALHAKLASSPSMKQVGHIVITKGNNFVQLALYLTGTLSKSAKQLLLNIAQEHDIQVCLLTRRNKTQTGEPFIDAYDQEIIGSLEDDLALTTLLTKNNSESLPDSSNNESNVDEASEHKRITLNVAPSHFVQVNEKVNQQMLSLARTWIYTYLDNIKSQNNAKQSSPVLYDFFCGAGNFSLALADLCQHVYAFEGVEDMVKTAALNASLNGVNNCEFEHVDLNNKAQLNNIQFAKNAIVVLDPSREGAQNLSSVLASKQLAMIIYVSCNPNSFARDIKLLNTQFEVTQICALDMFPYTKHIELMAKLMPRQQ